MPAAAKLQLPSQLVAPLSGTPVQAGFPGPDRNLTLWESVAEAFLKVTVPPASMVTSEGDHTFDSRPLMVGVLPALVASAGSPPRTAPRTATSGRYRARGPTS